MRGLNENDSMNRAELEAANNALAAALDYWKALAEEVVSELREERRAKERQSKARQKAEEGRDDLLSERDRLRFDVERWEARYEGVSAVLDQVKEALGVEEGEDVVKAARKTETKNAYTLLPIRFDEVEIGQKFYTAPGGTPHKKTGPNESGRVSISDHFVVYVEAE